MPLADRAETDLEISTVTGNTPGALVRGRVNKRACYVEKHHAARLASLADGVKHLAVI